MGTAGAADAEAANGGQPVLSDGQAGGRGRKESEGDWEQRREWRNGEAEGYRVSQAVAWNKTVAECA